MRNWWRGFVKILVAVDLSEPSEKIVKEAEVIAHSHSAKVWLLHVAEPEPEFLGWSSGPQVVRDSMSKKFHNEHRSIQGIAERLRKAGLDTTALLVQGAPAETILAEASKLGVDMTIVGSHGRGMVYQLLLGSVSEAVLRKSECPILIVPIRKRN